MIDLRSDTVTQPTPKMREAMARAPVGDDVFGEDPTVNQLEERTADLLGKESAMFVPSGTMGNQLAVRLHTQAGDEVILEAGAHIFNYESGASAMLFGVTIRPIAGQRGIFTAEDFESICKPPDIHRSPQTLVCVENTHNVGGGSVWPIGDLTQLSAAVHQRGLKLHLDGARLWNASAAAGIPEKTYADLADSVSVCFSKGLGAPIGSILAGTKEFIARGRRFRKMLGGGMRQAGVLAAAALYALDHHRQRLVEDHDNASALAAGLATIPGVIAAPKSVQTNIVRFSYPGADAGQIVASFREKGVLLLSTGADSFRAVTHLMISAADIARTIEIARHVFSQTPAQRQDPDPPPLKFSGILVAEARFRFPLAKPPAAAEEK